MSDSFVHSFRTVVTVCHLIRDFVGSEGTSFLFAGFDNKGETRRIV